MKKNIIVILCIVVVVVIVLAGLVFIPRTRSLNYDMHGFLVNADYEIIAQFPLVLTGKEYDFIIDRPGGGITVQGTTVTRVERDSIILNVEWDSEAVTPQYTFGHFRDCGYSANENVVFGSYYYYSSISNSMGSENGVLDLKNQTFCMHADSLLENAFIVGVVDTDTDPKAVIETYLQFVNSPQPETAEN